MPAPKDQIKYQEWIKKISNSSKGRKHTEEEKRKMVETRRKNGSYMLSKEHRKKISDANLRNGNVPPSRRGMVSWNKDKSLSEKHKKNLSIAHIGKKCSEETRIKMRDWQIKNPNRKFKETGIEKKMEAELQNRQIEYKKQVPLCNIANVDFYLPKYQIVIQCDGCYYHNCLIHYPYYHTNKRIRDFKQDIVLKSNGFNVYRFWEHEINESVEKCINKINFNK